MIPVPFEAFKTTLITCCIFIVFFILFYFIWKFLNQQFTKWSLKTESDLDDRIVAGLKSPSKLFLMSSSLGLSLQFSPLSDSLQNSLKTGNKILFVVSIIWGFERLLSAIILSDKLPASLPFSSRSLIRTIAKIFVASIGALVVLDTLGISITPLLASLGVGSVAIALAAQETLSNLFSGFYILLDKPFRIGDCIKIDSGAEGFVTKIGWRSTHIRLFANSMVVIPNAKIASSMITNFDLPESDSTINIVFTVPFDSDLKHVEQTVLEVAFLVQNKLIFASKNFAPSVTYTDIGELGIRLSVALRVQRITDGGALKHEFIKTLHHRFQQEALTLATPRFVLQQNETAGN